MSSSSFTFNPPPANELASHSTQEPQPVCTWSAHAPQSGPSPLPFPRHDHTLTAAATATTAGELFLFGGYVRGNASNDLYVSSTRDFSTSLLKTSGEVPHPRGGHGAALIGTTLLICGGETSAGGRNVLNHDSLYLLNLVSREWTRVVVNDPGPGRRYYHTTTVVGSRLFVFGGKIDRKYVNDMWTLDLNRLRSQLLWESYEPTPRNEKPLPRTRHVSVTTEDRIIIFGGHGDQYYNDTWSFDISTRKWTELQCTGSIPPPRSCHAAILVDGVMYVFGGLKYNTYLDDLFGLQLSTQRWFKFDNVGPSPHRRAYHTMASDGTRVFVLGGHSSGARVDEISLIHVFNTKDIKYPVSRLELERQLSVSLAAQTERDHHIAQLTDELAKKSALLEQAEARREHEDRLLAQTSMGKQRDAELLDMQSKLRSTEAKLDDLLLSSNRQVRQYEKELTNVRAKLEAKESELTEVRLRLADAEKGSTSLEELAASRDQQAGRDEKGPANVRDKLQVEGKESKLEAVRLRLAHPENGSTSLDELVASRDQQIERYEKELANMRAKLESKESELKAVRLRLADAEDGRAKGRVEANKLHTVTAASLVDLNEDRDTCELKEDMQAVEAELVSEQWNEKGIEAMEWSND